MTAEPLISILIPVRNGAKYLAECLDSILAQSYTNWECLIVNDNSSDHTWEILTQYVDQDKRISCHQSLGRGITPALQTAYSKSSGDFITRMDADDIMLFQKLGVLLDGLLKNGNGHLAIGGVEYFSADGVGVGYQSYANWLNGLTKDGSNWQDIYKECVIPSPCWMLAREDFEMCGAFRSDRYPEDYDLAFRMYAAGLKVIACDQILHQWRDYPERTSRNDPNYADNRFLELKLHWFVQFELGISEELILWGAGKKGKEIAKFFIKEDIDFDWVTDNAKKVGKEIYGQNLKLPSQAHYSIKSKVIIAVANRNEQSEIIMRLESLNLKRAQQYFLFC